MVGVGEELYLREEDGENSTVAVVLEARPDDEEPSYHLFLTGVRDGVPFTATRWVSRRELASRVRPRAEDQEKIALELLAVTGARIDGLLLHALAEMRRLLREAAEAARQGEDVGELRLREALVDGELRRRHGQPRRAGSAAPTCDLKVELEVGAGVKG